MFRIGKILALVLVAEGVFAADAPALKVGDAAPALSISKWLNGEAVASFEKGKVYVLECWATWCGPCVASIPHVSELNTALKDKGVVFIGLNVWERDRTKVDPFVKRMGERMNYRVAVDDEKNTTAQNWLMAAGRDGIPCAFVVDKGGKIAWIGHPMDGMDEVIEQVAAGTFDPKKQAEQEARREELQKKVEAAYNANDGDALLKLSDEMLVLNPKAAAGIQFMKFGILMQMKKDYAAAYAMAAKLLDSDWKNEPEPLNQAAGMILDEKDVQKRDLDLALKMAQRADEITQHANSAMLDTLARAYFEKGMTDKAIEAQTQAVAKADADSKEERSKVLVKYEAAKKATPAR
ncbi:MAG TPA: TlpA disulfide reductase family protein [Planctomycetota bacterium]